MQYHRLSPRFSPPFVVSLKGVVCAAFAPEGRTGIVDTMPSTPTERIHAQGVPLWRRSRTVVRNTGEFRSLANRVR